MLRVKKIVLSLIALSLCFGSVQADNGKSEALLRQISRGFSQVAKKGIPAVVYIESTTTPKEQHPSVKRPQQGPHDSPFDYFQDEFFNRFFGYPPRQQQPSSPKIVRGSGVIVSKDGIIMTNNHVVENATKVNITLSTGRKLTAEVLGTDPKTDLAVIKIERTEDLPYLTFADSDALEVGDWAIAVGNPFSLEASVTVGVVSAKGRNQLNITDFEDFIQTDAAINPGNSGGPLLNVEGEIIGINTAIVSGSGGYMGIGFAIPSNMAKRIMDQLIENGSVTRGFLGVTLQPIDSDLANFYKLPKVEGALVTDVVKGSPADIAGLKQEDIILAYNNIPVETLSSFRNAISLMPPGTKVNLRVEREGKLVNLNVTISAIPEEIAGPHSPSQKLGLKVEPLTKELAAQLNMRDQKGVVITHVEQGSPAAEAALRPGSLIMAVNRHRIEGMDDYNTQIQAAAKEGKVLLMVRQGEVVRFVALQFS